MHVLWTTLRRLHGLEDFSACGSMNQCVRVVEESTANATNHLKPIYRPTGLSRRIVPQSHQCDMLLDICVGGAGVDSITGGINNINSSGKILRRKKACQHKIFHAKPVHKLRLTRTSHSWRFYLGHTQSHGRRIPATTAPFLRSLKPDCSRILNTETVRQLSFRRNFP